MEDSVDSCELGSRRCEEQEETSTLRPRTNPMGPTEWTDEKHSLYLESMEASFVNQLNKSFNFFPRNSHRSCQSGSKLFSHKHDNTRASGQFMVLRDGRWLKIDFRDEAEGSQQDEPLLENQWIKHYRCSERQEPVRVQTDPPAKVTSATGPYQNPANNFRFWRQDPVSNNAEVIDQNFNNEGLEVQANSTCDIKRKGISSSSQSRYPIREHWLNR